MKPWRVWPVLLLVGLITTLGCGGDGTPDPGSDSAAAADDSAASGPAPTPVTPPAQADEPKTAEAAPQPEAEAPQAPQAAEASAEPSAAKKNDSATAEMLSLAQGSAPGNANAEGQQGPGGPAGGPGAPGGPGGQGMMAMGPGGGPPSGPPAGGMGPGGGMAGMQAMMAQQQQQNSASDMAKNMAKMMQASGAGAQQGRAGMGAGMPGGPGAMPGMPGAPGGPGGIGGQDNGSTDLHSPSGAVRAFLAALKDKNLDRLNEATALRAQVEANSSKNRALFEKINKLTLSEAELDELAAALDGFQVAFENPARSTGRLGVVVQKNEKNGSYVRHLVTVRREKKGWGVVDIGPRTVFKALGAQIQRNNPNQNRAPNSR